MVLSHRTIRTCQFFVLIFAVFAAVPECIGDDSDTPLVRHRRIINGSNASTREYPWVVSLQAKKESTMQAFFFGARETYCGGILLSPKWIVTAAHCLHLQLKNGQWIQNEAKNWHIRLVSERLKPTAVEQIKNIWTRLINTLMGLKKKQTFYHASRVVQHPNYIPGILEHDIALIKIKETLKFDKIDNLFLDLPPSDVDITELPLVGSSCVALGWGCGEAEGPPQMHVKKVELPVLSKSDCLNIYNAPINLTDTKEFCAGYKDQNKGICPGDSGGPLACKHGGKQYLAGITSATHSKHPSRFPGIFTRVSYFTKWIKDVMARY